MELERLKSCFIESGPPSDAAVLYLTKAHGEVRAAAQRLRYLMSNSLSVALSM